jgi:hypothetical protein
MTMTNQPKTDYEHSAELREARLQDASVGHKQLYDLAAKTTGKTTAERVASAARKRFTQQCASKYNK